MFFITVLPYAYLNIPINSIGSALSIQFGFTEANVISFKLF